MFSTWIMSIVVIAALGVLLDVIIPEGEIEKYIKGIFSILVIFVIIAPVPSLLNKNWSIEKIIDTENSMSVDNSYIDNLKESEYKYTEEALEKKLTEKYGECTVRILRGSEGKISFVIIDFTKMGISTISENKISVDSVKAEVALMLGVSQELIIVYE